jgi:6-phosphogluconolactonase
MHVIVYPTAELVARTAADLIGAAIADGARTIGLAGGGTPEATYRLLADRTIDWSGVTLWLSDERWVPLDHPESNAGMAKRTFVDAVGADLLIPEYGAGHAAAAASKYEAALFDAFGEDRTPDLVLLGIGDDGHTASLFPGTDALELTRSGYVANWVPAKDAWRMTATMPLLWEANHLVFLVTGEGKARVLAQMLDRGVGYPAQRVAAGAIQVTWLLDEPAAGELEHVDS